MGAGILPTVLDAAPSPKTTTANLDAASGPPLLSITANISAYSNGNVPSPHCDVLVIAPTDCSTCVFNVPSLHNNQKTACAFLLDPSKPRFLFNVNRTDGGKTHVMCVVEVLLNGVIIIITMLLTLSANQMAKFVVGDG